MRKLLIPALVSAILWGAAAAPTLASGTVILANGGKYFQASGPSSYWHYDWNEGYCGHIATWCVPAHFQWTYVTRTYGYVNAGYWQNPSPVAYLSRAYAFIPRKDATAVAEYTVNYNHVSEINALVDQSRYYDQWTQLAATTNMYLIGSVVLTDNSFYGSGPQKIAFDEIKIEN